MSLRVGLKVIFLTYIAISIVVLAIPAFLLSNDLNLAGYLLSRTAQLMVIE